MAIPAMFKPIINSLLKDVKLKFDADGKKIIITKGGQNQEYTFEQVEAMVNGGLDVSKI